MGEECLHVRRVVASGPCCSVEECGCGVLHVSLGALTIRLQAEVVASVYQTLGEALARVAAGHHAPACNHRHRVPDRAS